MIIFNTSALKKSPIDSSTWRGVQKYSMRSSDSICMRHQTAPDYSALQKTSNIVMAEVVNLNKVDMSPRCHQLVDINRLCRSKSPHAIPVQCEVTYINPLYSGIGETLFQRATQSVYFFAEGVI